MGAVPLTCKCLESKKIHQTLGDSNDETNNVAQLIDEANQLSCNLANKWLEWNAAMS